MSDTNTQSRHPGIDPSAPLPRDFSLTIKRGGVTLSMRVEHPSWTYPNWGLQIGVRIEEVGQTRHNTTSARKPDLPIDQATVGDALALFDSVGIVPCSTCGAPAFDPKTCTTNRAGECETCFLRRLREDFEREDLPSRIRELKGDIKRAEQHKAKGFTHHLLSMIHPTAGDDYAVEFYWKAEPKPVEIEALLKKRGSEILNDYRLTHLDALLSSLSEALATAEAEKATFAAEKASARKAAAKAQRDAKKPMEAKNTGSGSASGNGSDNT